MEIRNFFKSDRRRNNGVFKYSARALVTLKFVRVHASRTNVVSIGFLFVTSVQVPLFQHESCIETSIERQVSRAIFVIIVGIRGAVTNVYGIIGESGTFLSIQRSFRNTSCASRVRVSRYAILPKPKFHANLNPDCHGPRDEFQTSKYVAITRAIAR